MKTLVIAATIEEIQPSLFFLEDNQIPYLITGVGMVATTYALTKYLQKNTIDLLLHIGIGGILDSSANLGDIYQIHTDEIFEFGADDNGTFLPIEELGFGKRIYGEKAPVGIQIPETNKAQGITVNKVHGTQESVQWLQAHYHQNALIESMEGVASFFVAEQEDICRLQFRTISNYIEPRDRAHWEIGLAVENLNIFLQDFFKSVVPS